MTIAAMELAGDAAARHRRVFLSYASSDRAEVLKRAQGLRAAGLDFFQRSLVPRTRRALGAPAVHGDRAQRSVPAVLVPRRERLRMGDARSRPREVERARGRAASRNSPGYLGRTAPATTARTAQGPAFQRPALLLDRCGRKNERRAPRVIAGRDFVTRLRLRGDDHGWNRLPRTRSTDSGALRLLRRARAAAIGAAPGRAPGRSCRRGPGIIAGRRQPLLQRLDGVEAPALVLPVRSAIDSPKSAATARRSSPAAAEGSFATPRPSSSSAAAVCQPFG